MSGKKYLFLLAALLGSPLTYAADNNPHIASSFNDASQKYFFVSYGMSAFFSGLPKISSGLTNSQGQNMQSLSFNQVSPMYNLAIGYHFLNQNTLTSIFGNDNSIELDSHIVNMVDHGATNTSTYGRQWYINGTGGPAGPELNFLSSSVKSTFNDQDFNLQWQGTKELNNQTVFRPAIGLVYTTLHQTLTSNATIQTDPHAPSDLIYDYEHFNSRANILGLSVGGEIESHANPRFTPFANLNLQILHPNATINAFQDPTLGSSQPTQAQDEMYVNHSTSTLVTYRSLLTGGVDYYLFANPQKPWLELSGTLDNWGWFPEVVTPHGYGRSIHLAGKNIVNASAGITLHVPLI